MLQLLVGVDRAGLNKHDSMWRQQTDCFTRDFRLSFPSSPLTSHHNIIWERWGVGGGDWSIGGIITPHLTLLCFHNFAINQHFALLTNISVYQLSSVLCRHHAVIQQHQIDKQSYKITNYPCHCTCLQRKVNDIKGGWSCQWGKVH